MAIGTSDGEYYEDRWDYLTRSYQQAGNEEDQGREQVPLYRGGKNVTPKDKPPLDPKGTPEGGPKGIHTENFPNPFLDINKYTPTAPTSKPEPSPALKFWEHPSPKKVIPIREGEIDNEHHVPLIASAIMGDKGEMTGLAIDHRIKVPDEYLPHLALHEGTELPLMHDYMADGMSEQDAYHKAHDIATAVESASVRGHAARNGLDPDAYHERYKQFFRDAAGIAGEPTGVDRHPRAHTTVHGLDEAELGQKFAMIKPLSEQQILAPEPKNKKAELQHEENEENKNILRKQPSHGLEVEPKKIGDVIHPEFPQHEIKPPLQIDVLNAGAHFIGPGQPGRYPQDVNPQALPKTTRTMNKADRVLAKSEEYRNFMKRSKMHTEAGIDEKTQQPNAYLPANENKNLQLESPNEAQVQREWNEAVKKGLTPQETDLAIMEKTMRENPAKYKYYRAFFKQRGGENWKNWERLENLSRKLGGPINPSLEANDPRRRKNLKLIWDKEEDE